MSQFSPGRTVGGFTLLELLVVIVLIGVIAGFAALSVGDGGQGERLETEAQRLAALITLAGEEAVLDGRQLGLSMTPEGYRFLEYGEELWEVVESDRLFRARELPAGVAAELVVDGMPVDVKGPVDEENPEVLKPHLTFSPSGERTPFELTLAPADSFGTPDETTARRLEAGSFGPVTLRRPDSD